MSKTHLIPVITELYLNLRGQIAEYLYKIFEGESRRDKRVNPSKEKGFPVGQEITAVRDDGRGLNE